MREEVLYVWGLLFFLISFKYELLFNDVSIFLDKLKLRVKKGKLLGHLVVYYLIYMSDKLDFHKWILFKKATHGDCRT